MDLSTPAGEKWASRTLPPRPKGHINEEVAIGGEYRRKKRKKKKKKKKKKKRKKKKVVLECVQTLEEAGRCVCLC